MGNILAGNLFTKDCPALNKVFQFLLVTAVDWQQLLTASIWNQLHAVASAHLLAVPRPYLARCPLLG